MEFRNILTDDVFEILPVVAYKLLISHREELMIQWCEIESWCFRHGKRNSQIYRIANRQSTVNGKQKNSNSNSKQPQCNW